MKLISTKEPRIIRVGDRSDAFANERFGDPIGYLAGFGIEAELVSEELPLPEAA